MDGKPDLITYFDVDSDPTSSPLRLLCSSVEDPDPGSGAFLIQDPGSLISDPGSQTCSFDFLGKRTIILSVLAYFSPSSFCAFVGSGTRDPG
jgi:hypothetical protein